MRYLIYFGNIGTTKKVAETIKEKLNDFTLVDGTSRFKIQFNDNDTLVFGMNVRMKKINKKFIKFYKNLKKQNLKTNNFAYIVAADFSQRFNYIKQAADVLDDNLGIVFVGGELDPTNAKGLSKMVIESCIEQLKSRDLELPKILDNYVDELIEKIAEV